MIKQTGFPWVFSNIADRPSDESQDEKSKSQDGKQGEEWLEDDGQVEGTEPFWITQVNGIKIGVIGLVEKE